MFRPSDFLVVVRDAGLTKSEVALLYGVARQTVYGWLDGQVPRAGSLTDRMAFTITQTLLNLMRLKALPFPAYDPEVRKKKIEGLRSRLQNLKPAPVR